MIINSEKAALIFQLKCSDITYLVFNMYTIMFFIFISINEILYSIIMFGMILICLYVFISETRYERRLLRLVLKNDGVIINDKHK